MKYKSIADYIKKNTEMHGDFTVSVTDLGEKEEGMLLATIHPSGRDGDTADFYIHLNGEEEYTTICQLRRRNGKEKDMEENVKEIEGQELDMDVEPTAEEIAAAEKMAEEEPEG